MTLKSTRSTTINSPSSEPLAIEPREVVGLLRDTVFTLNATQLELNLDSMAVSVWGMVIETGLPDAVITLTALIDGSVSVYVSNGGGCVGCGADREVRTAGAHLLAVAEQSLPLAIGTDDTSHPPPGDIRFCFLSAEGLRSLQVRLDELHSVDAQLGRLYFAAQHVINTIERTGAGQSIEQEIRLAQSQAHAYERPASALETSPRGTQPCLSVGSAVHRLRR